MEDTNEFINRQNVQNLKRRLNVEADPDRRKVLLTLLAEEEAKLRKLQRVTGGGSIRIASQDRGPCNLE